MVVVVFRGCSIVTVMFSLGGGLGYFSPEEPYPGTPTVHPSCCYFSSVGTTGFFFFFKNITRWMFMYVIYPHLCVYYVTVLGLLCSLFTVFY